MWELVSSPSNFDKGAEHRGESGEFGERGEGMLK